MPFGAVNQGYLAPVIRSARPGSRQNSAIIGTGQSKFGGSSYEGGSTRFTRWTPKYAMATSDFTIEGWVRFNTTTAGHMVACSYTNDTGIGWALYVGATGTLQYFLSSTGTSWNIASGVTLATYSINTWYHVALVRSGSTFTPYKDGVAGTTTTSSSSIFTGTHDAIFIGGNNQVRLTGWLDEFRISNIARYTADFTPSTQPFQNDLNTELLCHFDGPNASFNFLDDNT